MVVLTHTTDEKARINLPKNFANSTVLVEQVSETELRIRKARVIPEDELPFVEEAMAPLSDRDRDVFLSLLDNPPPPNEALRRLLTSGHGHRAWGIQTMVVGQISPSTLCPSPGRTFLPESRRSRIPLIPLRCKNVFGSS